MADVPQAWFLEASRDSCFGSSIGSPTSFRQNLAGYLESGRPLAITHRGETLGFFIPARKQNRKSQVEAMHVAAKELDAMIASWNTSEDELVSEYKAI